MKQLLVAALLLLTAACAAPFPRAELGAEHPLVAKIWQPAQSRFIDKSTLIKHLSAARYLLLGEKHDNPDHHRLQAEIIARVASTDRRPAIALEMIDWDQAEALKTYLKDHPRDAEGLGAAIAWEKTGWPEWRLYAPIAEAALKAGLPVSAANVPRRLVRNLGKKGWPGLPPGLARKTGLINPLPEELAKSLGEEIYFSHCEMMPREHLGPVLRIQRARDAIMAEAMFAAADKADGAILIAGAGHARKDHGAPYYLRHLAPDAAILSVAFIEVTESLESPVDYARNFTAENLPFDFVWFTRRLENVNPCEKFKKQLQRLKKKT